LKQERVTVNPVVWTDSLAAMELETHGRWPKVGAAALMPLMKLRARRGRG
jgi:hypothetical protein